MPLFDLQCGCVRGVCLICFYFSVPAFTTCSQPEEKLGVVLHKENMSGFVQLISARDCIRCSEPEMLTRCESADFTDPCFFCSLSPRWRFFFNRNFFSLDGENEKNRAGGSKVVTPLFVLVGNREIDSEQEAKGRKKGNTQAIRMYNNRDSFR